MLEFFNEINIGLIISKIKTMSYKISNVRNHDDTRGWLCGQFFPNGNIFKTDQLEVKYSTIMPGEIVQKHFHPNGEELVIVIDGKMRAVYDGDEYLLEKGDFIFQQARTYEEIVEVIEPTTLCSIRTPSIPDNKIIVDTK